MSTILLSTLVVTIQLADSYLRYLSFRDVMTEAEKKILGIRFAACSVACEIFYTAAFNELGITAPVYKAMLIGGWIPWLAVFMLSVRRDFLQHVFIFGMSLVWSTMQHNWAAIAVVIILPDSSPNEFVTAHAGIYLLLFAACLTIARRYFVKLLPQKSFFDDYGTFTALFPLAATLGVIVLWAQEPMIHSWQERFSRFYLPFVFFFFYRHILTTTDRLREQKRTAQNLQRMREQISALKEYNRLMQESRERVAVIRHDMRHNYRLLYVMLQAEKISAAKEFIESQERLLDGTAIKSFCPLPLINAALSIYIHRAESLGITVRHKINMAAISVDESDCAILISNLMENAIRASLRQPSNRRSISVVIQNVGEQSVMEIANRYDEAVLFDEKNMPRTVREGHGLGMASVKIFADKYKAYTDFSHKDGVFKATVYWMNCFPLPQKPALNVR